MQDNLTKIKALYKGKGDRLNQPEIIFAVTYDKRYHRLSYVYWAN